jgi:hypothetical protein
MNIQLLMPDTADLQLGLRRDASARLELAAL